jgi:hypothetical protein
MKNFVHNKLDKINNILLREISDMKNPGLLNGKMGVSLYFFHLAKETESREHQEFAEQLIDEVYEEVGKNQLPPDFENGLAGIAWCIEYLVQNGFVEAETDQILRDVNDKIYRFISSNQEFPVGILQGVMGYMVYILSLLNGKDLNSNDFSTMIFRRLLIGLINRLGAAIEENKLMVQEPRLFEITWELPLSLVLLSRCYALGVHTTKIERILDHIAPYIITLYPRFSYHRLYLLFGMETVLQQINLPEWKHHADFLKQGIQTDNIIDHELKNKNILFQDGTAGVAFISRQVSQLSGYLLFMFRKEQLIQKITTSEYWEWIERKQPEKKMNPGLMTGLTGIAMELLELLIEQPEKSELIY